jgi:hypothetical protein
VRAANRRHKYDHHYHHHHYKYNVHDKYNNLYNLYHIHDKYNNLYNLDNDVHAGCNDVPGGHNLRGVLDARVPAMCRWGGAAHCQRRLRPDQQ